METPAPPSLIPAACDHRRVSVLKTGALAGLGGGLTFGLLMGMTGFFPVVAQMVGSSRAALGFLLHLGISGALGGVYGLAACRLPASGDAHLAAGVVNGLFWWVTGALVLMPVFLGIPEHILHVGPLEVFSLIGHLVYGLTTSGLFRRLAPVR